MVLWSGRSDVSSKATDKLAWCSASDRILFQVSQGSVANCRREGTLDVCMCVCIYIYIYTHTHTHNIMYSEDACEQGFRVLPYLKNNFIKRKRILPQNEKNWAEEKWRKERLSCKGRRRIPNKGVHIWDESKASGVVVIGCVRRNSAKPSPWAFRHQSLCRKDVWVDADVKNYSRTWLTHLRIIRPH